MQQERLLMRFRDGPLQGDKVMERDWPLPDMILSPNGQGRYLKVQESTLHSARPGVLRGAEYQWDASFTISTAMQQQ